jgi:tetratricopeptide (TPR) repeat protein
LAQTLGNAELLAEAALASNSGQWHAAGSVDQEQFAILDAALTAIGHEDSTTRARLLALYALGPFGRDNSAERLRVGDEAVAMARRIGDDDCLLEVLVANHVSGRTAERLPALVAEEPSILELAERVGNPQQLVLVYGYAYSQRLEMGDLEQADRHLERLAQIADEVNNPYLRWMATSYHCTRLIVSGSGDDVETAALAARQLGQDADLPDTLFWFDAQIYSARWKQGRLAEVVDLVRQNMADHPEMPVYRAQLAYTLARIGEQAEAMRLVDDLTFGLLSPFPDDFLRLTSQCYVAEACAILGTVEQAADQYILLAPYADRFPSVGTSIRYSVSLVLAVLAARTGQGDRAEEHFADAEAHHLRVGALGWLARSRLEWGRFLVAQGDNGRARALLEEAREAASEVGAADVVGATDALLAEIG